MGLGLMFNLEWHCCEAFSEHVWSMLSYSFFSYSRTIDGGLIDNSSWNSGNKSYW